MLYKYNILYHINYILNIHIGYSHKDISYILGWTLIFFHLIHFTDISKPIDFISTP